MRFQAGIYRRRGTASSPLSRLGRLLTGAVFVCESVRLRTDGRALFALRDAAFVYGRTDEAGKPSYILAGHDQWRSGCEAFLFSCAYR
jgi:hypothetical protein